MPGTARSASLIPTLFLLLLALGGGVLFRPGGAIAQAPVTAPAAAPAPVAAPAAAPRLQDEVAALEGILATLRNDTSRAAFMA
ncbi:MAG: hypothetical protein JWP20_2668 [Roseomonas sp.]|nr:hypothetical protein [Roseomonas sp.]